MISRYPAGNLPQSGGINATVMVTMSLETLLGGLESADLLMAGRWGRAAAYVLVSNVAGVALALTGFAAARRVLEG